MNPETEIRAESDTTESKEEGSSVAIVLPLVVDRPKNLPVFVGDGEEHHHAMIG